MSEFHIPKSDLTKFGHLGWQWDGENLVVRCPNGHVAVLDHEVSLKGEVTPSIQCPKCEFHESGVILDGFIGT